MEGDERDVQVVHVTIDHWEALCALFASSRDVKGCWCMWPRHEPMTHRPDQVGNKAKMKALVTAGELPGLLALVAQRAVGWCAVGPRHWYPQYGDEHEDGIGIVWVIRCIFVRSTAKRRTVARALIEAAAQLAARNSAVAIDGPPPWWLPGDAAAIARATTMFLDNGFSLIGTGARMPQLRRILTR